MFEKFMDEYFSRNSFLELANACFNEAGVYFGRNTSGGLKNLTSVCADEKLTEYISENSEKMLEETKRGGDFVVALPMGHQAFPIPFPVLVDKCMGEVTFLCGFERVFREREEHKEKLTEYKRDEITAVIKILACAARAETDWSDSESVLKLLSSKDACECVGYDIVQYFNAYRLGFAKYYLKNFLDCISVIKEEKLIDVIAKRAKGEM